MQSLTRPNPRGMTLIELLIASTLLSVVLIAVLTIFNAMTLQWKTQVSRGQAIRIANVALAEITKDLRSAVIFQAADGTKTNTFTMPANTDANGNYVPAWTRIFLVYPLGPRTHYYLSDLTGSASSGTVLWRETNPNPTGSTGWTPDSKTSLAPGSLSGGSLTPSARGNVDHVASLSFTTVGMVSNTVQVSISISYQEGKITRVYTISRLIYLSNHN